MSLGETFLMIGGAILIAGLLLVGLSQREAFRMLGGIVTWTGSAVSIIAAALLWVGQ